MSAHYCRKREHNTAAGKAEFSILQIMRFIRDVKPTMAPTIAAATHCFQINPILRYERGEDTTIAFAQKMFQAV